MRKLKYSLAVVIFSVAVANGAEIFVRSNEVKKISMDPFDKAWKKAASSAVTLIPQTFTVPHGGGSVKFVEVKSFFTMTDLYVRLTWDDNSRNAAHDFGGRFSDGCALQFPVEEGILPSPFMGEDGRPVNIWHWRAANSEDNRYEKAYSDYHRPGAIEEHVFFSTKPARSLYAEGFGTLTTGQVQDVLAAGVWKDGRWSVVFKRALTSQEGTAFIKNSLTPIAFAVWDGEDQERDGAKSLSLWQTLILGEAKPEELRTPEVRGERIFGRYGCATCHGPAGRGGVKNLNAQGGEVPPIYKVREGFTEAEVEQVIRLGRRSVPEDANAPMPSLRMNNWGLVMSEEELHDLVKYLWTLAPKGEEW
ncbi:MAG: hypothetical protein A2901_00760 [Elusimicrobia bacterium RIFCSPLOWO2_01_FULL_54_10]|nr:MAG: hypothetical protein A2901_00760 [Elusimicrobia bacterium RIFCSPLOWO2_01_FULL_54_10]